MNRAEIERTLNTAVSHLRSGRPQDAEPMLRAIVAADPRNPDVLHLLGVALLQQRKAAEAVEPLRQASQLRPTAPDFLANLGNALRAVNRLDEAADALQRAVNLKPDYVIAHVNLGAVRRGQGKPELAVESLRTAAKLAPQTFAVWMNLGNALRDLAKFDEALDAFVRARSLVSNSPDVYAAIGSLLAQAGKHAEATEQFQTALRMNPNHFPTLLAFGGFLRQQNDFDNAIVLLSRAVQVDPNNADAHERLARVLWSACKYDDALRHFERAYQLAPTPRLRFAIATLVPPAYASVDDVSAWRKRIEDQVAALERDQFKFDVTNEPPPSIVYLPYQGLDDRDLAERMAKLCTVQPLTPAPSPSTGRGGKTRVGFVSSLFKNQTVGLWTQGLIAQLDRSAFDLTTISTSAWSDETATFIREHSDHYVVLPPTLYAAREVIAKLDLDVLIYTDFGMDPWTAALAFARLARVQCLAWGHPITSGLTTIDYFLSNRFAESEDETEAQRHYTEKLVRFEHLPVFYYRPRPPSATVSRAEFGLPDDAKLYGCLQAQYKLHPSFDVAIGGILRRDPKGIVLLSRGGTARAEHIISKRLTDAFPDVSDRVRFIPTLDRDKYRALTAMCEVLLAPFPFGAGDSALEGFALGLPTVTLPTPHLKGRLTFAMYKLMGFDDAIARDAEHYVEIAVQLGTNREVSRALRERIRASDHVLFENQSAVRELEMFFKSTQG